MSTEEQQEQTATLEVTEPQVGQTEGPATTQIEEIEVETFELTDEVREPEPAESTKSEGANSSVEKALKDTKAWATKLSQDNALLRQAVESAVNVAPPALLSDPQVALRFKRAKDSLADFEEFGPLIDLLDTVIRGVGSYEREMAHQALLSSVLNEHPDALELKSDNEFISWATNQPPLVRQCLVHSTDPSDVNWALRQFKNEKVVASTAKAREAVENTRKEKIRHNLSPSPQTGSAPTGPRWTREDIAGMSLDDYRQNEALIDAALARGEID